MDQTSEGTRPVPSSHPAIELLGELKDEQAADNNNSSKLSKLTKIGKDHIRWDVIDSGNDSSAPIVGLLYTQDTGVSVSNSLSHGNSNQYGMSETHVSNSIHGISANENTNYATGDDSHVTIGSIRTGEDRHIENLLEPAVNDCNHVMDSRESSSVSDVRVSSGLDERRENSPNEKEKEESDISETASEGAPALDDMSNSDNNGNADDEMSDENEFTEDEESACKLVKPIQGGLNEQMLREISQISMIGFPNEEEENNRLQALKISISLQAETAQLRRLEFQRKQGELIRRRIMLSEKQKRTRQNNSLLGVPLLGDPKNLLSAENSDGKTFSTDFKFGPHIVSNNTQISKMDIKAQMPSRCNSSQF